MDSIYQKQLKYPWEEQKVQSYFEALLKLLSLLISHFACKRVLQVIGWQLSSNYPETSEGSLLFISLAISQPTEQPELALVVSRTVDQRKS